MCLCDRHSLWKWHSGTAGRGGQGGAPADAWAGDGGPGCCGCRTPSHTARPGPPRPGHGCLPAGEATAAGRQGGEWGEWRVGGLLHCVRVSVYLFGPVCIIRCYHFFYRMEDGRSLTLRQRFCVFVWTCAYYKLLSFSCSEWRVGGLSYCVRVSVYLFGPVRVISCYHFCKNSLRVLVVCFSVCWEWGGVCMLVLSGLMWVFGWLFFLSFGKGAGNGICKSKVQIGFGVLFDFLRVLVYCLTFWGFWCIVWLFEGFGVLTFWGFWCIVWLFEGFGVLFDFLRVLVYCLTFWGFWCIVWLFEGEDKIFHYYR